MPDSSYDCIVIGSGPGGYVAAIRAAQLGMKTAVVERDVVGGRCLNYACIPAKAVLRVADVLAEIDEADDFGISVARAHGRLRQGHGSAARRSSRRSPAASRACSRRTRSTYIEGHGSVTDDGNVKVGGNFDGTEIEAKTVILATGSVPKPIPGTEFGGRVIGTEEAWALEDLPETMVVAGAGASGAEIASAYARLGTQVMLFEALDRVAARPRTPTSRRSPGAGSASRTSTIHTGTKVENVETGDDKVTFKYGDETAEVDWFVIAAGRGPDVEGLGLEEAGVKLDDSGLIDVDGALRTSVKGVYAIGDLVPGPALAHKASDEGIIAVEDAAGMETHPIEYIDIPRATFCTPNVGSFGAHRGAGAGAGLRRRGRQGQLRRGRRRHGLRRPRRHDQDHRRQEVRRADRRPHRRRPRDRADPGARQRQRARGRLPRGRRASSTATPRCPRPSWRPRARPTAG